MRLRLVGNVVVEEGRSLVGPGKQCGFYPENHDPTTKGFKPGVNMI